MGNGGRASRIGKLSHAIVSGLALACANAALASTRQ